MGKISSNVHALYPLQARSYLRSEEEYRAFHQRHAALQMGKLKIDENLHRLTTCEEVLTRRCEATIAELVTLRDAEVARIARVREEIAAARAAALEEIEQNLWNAQLEPRTPLGAALFDFCLGKQSNLSLFAFTEEPLEVLKPSWVRITYTPPCVRPQKQFSKAEKSVRHFLPVLTPTSVARYMVASSSVSSPVQLQCSICVNEYCTSVRAGNDEVFVCDGTGQCSLVDTRSGQVKPLQTLAMPRVLSGLLYRQGQVFLIGGCTQKEYLQTGEYFQLSQRPQLGSLASLYNARDSFNPVVHLKSIFVVGGRGYSARMPTEQFSFERSEYTVLEFSLPAAPTLSIFLGDLCVTVQANLIVHYDIRTRKVFQKKHEGAAWSSCPPFILGDFVFTLHQGEPTKTSLKQLKK